MDVSGEWELLPEDRAETIVYRRIGGYDLRLLLLRPDQSEPGSSPCIIFIHGGGFTGGEAEMLLPQCRWFAKRGFACVTADYRLMKMEEERPAADSVTLDECIADCKAAVRFVRRHADRWGIDPGRIVLAGESAGGYLACAVSALHDLEAPGEDTTVSCVPDLLVAYNPITQLAGKWGHWVQDAPLPDEPPVAEGEAARRLARFRRARRLSPLWSLTERHPPLLIMHGLEDAVVLPEDSAAYADKVSELGVEVRLELLPGSDHAFALFNYRASDEEIGHALETTLKFVRRFW
ncbi:alpha/beta hydrolase [Cohnella zeiphila]|uniref:Alpha/beta hydrolase n=1 Tax=Cohnella zeiphila TaxID=2761120 RepID=A0A7X0SSU4_9BACL|nr:alpha/beta hydrolase [Cohnella zeiphila]MBB6734235.1 alpha/beta hydrolase [Cohnella zeiphila]